MTGVSQSWATLVALDVYQNVLNKLSASICNYITKNSICQALYDKNLYADNNNISNR